MNKDFYKAPAGYDPKRFYVGEISGGSVFGKQESEVPPKSLELYKIHRHQILNSGVDLPDDTTIIEAETIRELAPNPERGGDGDIVHYKWDGQFDPTKIREKAAELGMPEDSSANDVYQAAVKDLADSLDLPVDAPLWDVNYMKGVQYAEYLREKANMPEGSTTGEVAARLLERNRSAQPEVESSQNQ
ncbi:MAG: hypothetical protein LBL08_02930 [Candidatus Nomurabacteria bacterium]|jgi:hypothetical protein|nr:hypothetical protein [Candidatus Nomurabacteria bacterium]